MISESTVFVVDDDENVRNAMRWLIEPAGYPVEAYATARDFLEGQDPSRPGCLIVDVRLPGMSGFELLEHVVNRKPSIPVIVITGYGDVRAAVRAMKCGALDFIEKPFDNDVLLRRIREAVELDRHNRAEHTCRSVISARVGKLTRREREVMNLVVNGLPNKAIAAELHVSQKTVEAHRANTMRKMQANSLPDLVRFAHVAEEMNGQAASFTDRYIEHESEPSTVEFA